MWDIDREWGGGGGGGDGGDNEGSLKQARCPAGFAQLENIDVNLQFVGLPYSMQQTL